MAEGTALVNHLKYMEKMADKLTAIEAPISEEDQIVASLGSLPNGFSNLVTVLESKGNLTLQNMQQALLNKEQKRNEKPESSGSDREGALAAGHYGGAKPRRFERGACFKCGSVQHYQKDCPKSVKEEIKSMATHCDDAEVAFVTSDSGKLSKKSWIIDSASSSHMAPQQELFAEYRELEPPKLITVSDGHQHLAIGVGSVRVKLKTARSISRYATLRNVLYAPEMKYNLVSIRAATENDIVITFSRSRCWFKDQHEAT